MDQAESNVTERFLNFGNSFSGSNLINTAINCIVEKDSMIVDSDLQRKNLHAESSYYLLNYFDPEIGDYKKIMVKRVKK